MPDRLHSLLVNRVAFVPKGDNPHADILLWKAEPSSSDVHVDTVLGGTKAKAKFTPRKVRARVIDGVKKEPRFTRSRLSRLQEAVGVVTGVIDEVDRKEDVVPEPQDDTSKGFTLPDDTPEDVRKAFEDLKAERDEAKKAAATPAPVVKEPEADPIDTQLAKEDLDPGVRAALESAKIAKEQAATSQATVEKLREESEVAKAVETAGEWKHLSIKADDFGPMLRKIRETDADVAKEVERVLTSANAVAKEAMVAIGKDGGDADAGTDAFEKLQAMAKELQKADPELSAAKAFEKATTSPEGRALHSEYRKEVREG